MGFEEHVNTLVVVIFVLLAGLIGSIVWGMRLEGKVAVVTSTSNAQVEVLTQAFSGQLEAQGALFKAQVDGVATALSSHEQTAMAGVERNRTTLGEIHDKMDTLLQEFHEFRGEMHGRGEVTSRPARSKARNA